MVRNVVRLQAFVRLHDDIAHVGEKLAKQQYEIRGSRTTTVPTITKSVGYDAMKAFTSSSPMKVRFIEISSNIAPYQSASEHLMPTSWISKPPIVKGMPPIDLECKKTLRQVRALCKKKALLPPSGFVLSHSHYYGKYDADKLVSVLGISAVNMNKTPGSMAISVDIAASTDKHHSMSIGINSLKKMLGKRRNPCVLFAQVAQTNSARSFWMGKLHVTKRASVMPVLFNMFDPRYVIYEDVNDMGA